MTESDRIIRDVERSGWVIGALMALVTAPWFGLEMMLFVLLGVLLSTLNMRWLRAGVDRALGLPSADARSYALVRFFLRLCLIMICLYVTIRVSFRGTLACVAGFSSHLLGAMVVGVGMAFTDRRRAPRNTG